MEMPTLPAGTVTFLFTDIEGSTRLLDDLGPHQYAAALAEHRGQLREVFAHEGGVEVDTQGDAFFFAFPDASEAVAAAGEGQAALVDGQVSVRMGIHTGEPLLAGEGYVGIDVNRAARICSTAHGGQVVLSAATRALLGSEDVVDLGLHRLKDLSEPEKLYQLGGRKFPPLRSLNATNLPTQATPLVGRKLELQELVSLVPRARLITLTGPGGTGKTRLALQVAAEVVDKFGDGVFWVSLAPVTDPALVFPTIASELGAKGDLSGHIDEARMLLLLDNLEQVSDVVPQLSALLHACPNLHLLVTSRALLRIEGEVQYALDPLPADDAVTLFRQRAAVAEPTDAVVEICLRLDCLPLAVELAAARTALLPPDELLARLEQRLPLLTRGRRDAPERQRTLRATIEWSYELLNEEEKELFQRLAIFAGSFDVTAAETVAGAEIETLQSLVEKSLLRRAGSARMGMLETIHEFALEQLHESGRAEDMRRRHAAFLLTLAESANLSVESEGPQRNDLVQPEVANVRAALQGCLRAGDVELAIRLLVAMEHFWVGTSPHEAIQWLERVMPHADNLPPALSAQALRVWGGVTFIIGRFDEGTRLHERSLEAYRRIGDERGVAHILHRLVMPALLGGDTIRARTLNDESLEIVQRTSDRKGVCMAIGSLGEIEIAEGNQDRGLELLRESVTRSEEIGFSWWTAVTLGQLAEHLFQWRRLEEAERCCRESLSVAHSIGERQWMVFSLGLLARIAAHTNRAELAGTLWGAIETEEARGIIGQWEAERAEYLTDVAKVAGPEFDRGRERGRNFTLAEIVQLTTVTNGSTR